MTRSRPGHAATLAGLLICLALAQPAPADSIADAVDNPARPAQDLARDARDRPGALLRFFGVRPGMVVLDLFGAGGWWTELLNTAVGPDGTVIYHNNAAYRAFLNGAEERRVANGRLANTRPWHREHDALDLQPGSLDLVLMSMNFHDFFFKADGWDVSADVVMPQLHAALKDGGLLAVIDHAAVDGTGASMAQSLHRIDEAFVRRDLAARGFTLVGSTDMLRQPGDPRTSNVFDPAIRGRTDRFVLLFRKQ